MQFKANAKPISQQGLSRALEKLQMSPAQTAALWSVFEVETSGTTQGFGFRPDKRPQILFERHIFRKYTDQQFSKAYPDLSGPQGNYGALSLQYEKLDRALTLCHQHQLGAEPALKACSWGIGQVMGFNHALAGYSSAMKMVQAMILSEDDQLWAMVNFLDSTGLAKHLRSQNWTAFAKGYNGPSYAANHYDVKLAENYARFSSGSMPNLEIRTVQAALLVLGYPPGKIDGVPGPRTHAMLKNFQISQGLPATGDLDSVTYQQITAKAFS
jgi:hypothetical protein